MHENEEVMSLPTRITNVTDKISIDNNYILYNRYFEETKRTKGIVPFAIKKQSKAVGCENNIPEINSIAKSLPFHKSFKFKLRGKLAIGTGSQSPFDTTALITLHPIYGIPYIPGSSIKGVIRNSYIQSKFGGKEPKGSEDEAFKTFVKLFGIDSGNDSGIVPGSAREKLIFFDAFLENYKLRYDVQTPHFKDYYDSFGKKQPRDTINPTLLYFPVVDGGNFTIHICGYNENCEFNDMEKVIKNAFTINGIGAKTALGYGLCFDDNVSSK